MAKKPVFFSFHFDNDCWRAGQVRNMGVVEGDEPVSSHDWEAIQNDDEKVKKWIDEKMKYKQCVIVLTGSATGGRKWINYEIVKGWDAGKGIVGINIHNLKDMNGHQSSKGTNPFSFIKYGNTGNNLNSIVNLYDPPHSDSKLVYGYINENIEKWVEEAIKIRASH